MVGRPFRKNKKGFSFSHNSTFVAESQKIIPLISIIVVIVSLSEHRITCLTDAIKIIMVSGRMLGVLTALF